MAEIDRLLMLITEVKGSDLHLTAGLPPMVRVHGSIKAIQAEVLNQEHVERMLFEIMPSLNRKEFEDTNDTDFAHHIPKVARYRVNVFKDIHGIGGVLRVIPNEILSLEQLGVPSGAKSFCDLKSGLILVTGPTGSGKSTTLAGMIDHINRTRDEHIITIEDPIEFVHQSKKCLIHQREVRSHTQSFSKALRAALREDPDIVLVGEMRDLETTRIAIETAETGHLVFGTLHTRTAPSTIDRLISQFPAAEQDQIRTMVSNSLKGVIAQSLLKKKSKGRVAAFEVLVVNPAVQNTIREQKLHQLLSIMQVGAKHGMICLNDSLLRLALEGIVEIEDVIANADDRDDLLRKLQVAGIPLPRTALDDRLAMGKPANLKMAR